MLLGLASLALLCWTGGAFRQHRRARWHPLLTLLGGVALVAAISLVPLPERVLEVLSPANAELRDFALVPLGLEAPRPLTVDAPSTWRALARVIAFAAIAFVSLQLGRRPGPRRRLLMVIAATGAFTAVVGFGHLLAGADALFGAWRYSSGITFVSFFGNQNHLAGFLAFSATVALGLALDTRSREQAVGWVVVAFGCGVAVVLSFSRGGVASFIVTWALVAGLHLARRQGGLKAVLPWLVIGAVGLFAFALAAEPLLDRLATVATMEKLQQSKLELWPMFWDAARSYARAGMGLGSFELAFSRFQTQHLDFTFTHPENLVLQWASELGFPLFVALMAGVAFVGWRLSRRAVGTVLESTVLLAVVGVGLHDLFDFALELNALPVSVMVALGVCAAREKEEGPQHRARVGLPVLASSVLVVAGGVFALSQGLPPHGDAEAALLELVKANRPVPEVRARAVEVIDRHPSDWVPYAAVANDLSRLGSARETLAWTNRVLFLRPRDPDAHVAAGRALLRLGRQTQALLEFKTAWLLGDSSSLDEGLVLAARLGGFDRLLVDTSGLLTRLWRRSHELNRKADAQALLDAVEQLPPSNEVLSEARVLAVLQAQATGQPAEAVRRLEGLPADVQARPELVVLNANALALLGRADEGIARLEALAHGEPQNLTVALALAALLGQAHRTSQAREVINRSRPFVSTPAGRANLFVYEAELWLADERFPRALEALQTASRIEPGRADLRYRVAQVYERMGRHRAALEEVRQGRLIDTPEGARAQDAWVERLTAAIAGSMP